MRQRYLRTVAPDEVLRLRRDPVDPAILEQAAAIVDDVRRRGLDAVREHAVRLGDVEPDAAIIRTRDELDAALVTLGVHERQVLERTAERIRQFAEVQRHAIRELTMPIPGGSVGHRVSAVGRAGCYAPGGRFPLPSSVLMTAVPARAAGVRTVWVASPRPSPVVLAAAAVAGADGFLAVGGAQAIAAFAYGAGDVPACDVVVGPGNRWVTAAKRLVFGQVGIDMLAGPSELVVLADETADPARIAADLLAQAEHDPDAYPVVVSLNDELLVRVESEIDRQMATLPTAQTARAALSNGMSTVVKDLDQAVSVCDRLAPEHLELMLEDATSVAERVSCYGGLFIGQRSAEVLGDYGAGPNHVLPTGGTARFSAGLSVVHFLSLRTWLRIDDPKRAEPMIRDAIALARMEGLEAHARAAELRIEAQGDTTFAQTRP